MLVSTHGFLKSISNVSGKDIGPLIKQWVYPSLSCLLDLSKFLADFNFLSCCFGTHKAFLRVVVKFLMNSTIQGDLQTKNQAPAKAPRGHLYYLSCFHTGSPESFKGYFWSLPEPDTDQFFQWIKSALLNSWLLGTSLSWVCSFSCVRFAASVFSL